MFIKNYFTSICTSLAWFIRMNHRYAFYIKSYLLFSSRILTWRSQCNHLYARYRCQLCRQWEAMICERLTTGVIGGLYTEDVRRQPTTDWKAFALAIGALCECRLIHPLMEGKFCRRDDLKTERRWDSYDDVINLSAVDMQINEWRLKIGCAFNND